MGLVWQDVITMVVPWLCVTRGHYFGEMQELCVSSLTNLHQSASVPFLQTQMEILWRVQRIRRTHTVVESWSGDGHFLNLSLKAFLWRKVTFGVINEGRGRGRGGHICIYIPEWWKLRFVTSRVLPPCSIFSKHIRLIIIHVQEVRLGAR